MSECRFFPECARCNEIGDSWFPCEGGADGTRCADYAPMPDVDALLKLANEMDSAGEDGLLVRDSDLMAWARRIREALGGSE